MNLELGQAERFSLDWHENADCDQQECAQVHNLGQVSRGTNNRSVRLEDCKRGVERHMSTERYP